MLSASDKIEAMREYQRKEGDTGSPEAQIALLTARIRGLQSHFENFKQDKHSRRGLMKMVAQRRKLMKYLKRVNLEGYRALIEKLGIRG